MDGWLTLGRALHVSGQTKEALQILREARKTFGNQQKLIALVNELRLGSLLQFEGKPRGKLVKRFGLERRIIKLASLIETFKSVFRK
jgi:hypothetical protein